MNFKKKSALLFSIPFSLFVSHSVEAARLIDLRHQSPSILLTINATQSIQFKTVNTHIDFNQVKHTRYQEYYDSYPVWHATFIKHEPQNSFKSVVTMNGIIYESLASDLPRVLPFNPAQQQKVLQKATSTYASLTQTQAAKDQQVSAKEIIYIDEKNIAHYAYLTSFFAEADQAGMHQPTMIIDANTLYIYQQWDQVMTLDNVIAGGVGGNAKTGRLIYDGGRGHLPGIKMKGTLAPKNQFSVCYFKNDDVIVNDTSYGGVNVIQQCQQDSNKHNNTEWLDWDNNETSWLNDEVNQGYSPSIDSFYAGNVITSFFHDWYGIPAWVQEDGKTPMPITINAHYGRNFENAMFIINKVYVGDGGERFYPLTSIDVIAHEVGHGFTWQHSFIGYPEKQMSALNESFSDMTSAAVKFYVNGKNDWNMGDTITKHEEALRYMDDPKKDGVSIDNMKDYNPNLDAHFITGIPNKAFYLLATTPGWDTHKAYNVMIKANMDYWTSSMKTFSDAACGVMDAAKDYAYSVEDIKTAFANVGVDTSNC